MKNHNTSISDVFQGMFVTIFFAQGLIKVTAEYVPHNDLKAFFSQYFRLYHGLIAAVEDQSSGIQWYNGSNVTTGAADQTIGAGSANTDAIINAQGATSTSYAAGLARAYTGGGYTDWFLPSRNEAYQMFINKALINNTAAANSGSDLTEDAEYWSSSEKNNNVTLAYWFEISNGSSGVTSKGTTYNVRAVRAF